MARSLHTFIDISYLSLISWNSARIVLDSPFFGLQRDPSKNMASAVSNDTCANDLARTSPSCSISSVCLTRRWHLDLCLALQCP